eukprot:Hpha_TRINITY_DN15018_c11_g5::TRINITY_DN15018_c11_g5_i2::g.124812::m.124812
MEESEQTRATRRRRRWNRRQGRDAAPFQGDGDLLTRCGSPEPRPPPLWGRAVLELATGRTYEQLAAELQAEQPGLTVADFGAILRQQHRRETALGEESVARDDSDDEEDEEDEEEEEDEATGPRRVLRPLRAARRRAKDVAMAVLEDDQPQRRRQTQTRRQGSQKRSASRDPSLARNERGNKRRREVSLGTDLRERLAVLNLRPVEAP